jgi:hypothetical protein
MDATSVGLISGNYTTTSVMMNTSRRLFRGTSFTSSISARKYGSATYSNYNRWIYAASAGLTFAPGDIPLRIW